MPLFIREGAVIPLGPVMNYVDEKRTDRIDLLVSLYAGDGRSTFDVPVNGLTVPVDYTASGGKHRITIGRSDVEFAVEVLGCGDVTVSGPAEECS